MVGALRIKNNAAARFDRFDEPGATKRFPRAGFRIK
jgi:hypothetical protein